MAEKAKQPSAVVLLSAGLDSAYNLVRALGDYSVRLVLTFDYGQKAAVREVERSARLTQRYGLQHQSVKLPWFSLFTKTALVSTDEVPRGEDVSIENLSRSMETAKNVWVPNRNGIFLNIAAGFAEGLEAQFVIPGFNSEEAATFPDNSMAFLKSLNTCWNYSTDGRVRTNCFSAELSKAQIVRRAMDLNLPFADLWPCYLAEEQWCGTCESCLRFKRAVQANGLSFEELRSES